MAEEDAALAALTRGLDQMAGLLAEVSPEQLGRSTPCQEWTLTELIDHVVDGPTKSARMVRGEKVDWSAPTPHVGQERVEVFRAGVEDLLVAWRDASGRDVPMSPDWQCAELAVHSYDLAATLGRSTSDLDPEVAERGLAFMQANLTADNRGAAFGPERSAPEDADAYQRIAAFAGRAVLVS